MKFCFVLVALNWSLMKRRIPSLAVNVWEIGRTCPRSFESRQRISPDIRNVWGRSHVLQGVVERLAPCSAAEVSCPAGECSSCVADVSRKCLDVIQLRVCITAPLKFQQVCGFSLSLQFLLVNILSIPSYLVSIRQIFRRCKRSFFHGIFREGVGLRADRLPGLRVQIPPGSFIPVSCECYVLSGRGLCDGTGASSRVVLPIIIYLWSRKTSTMGRPRPE
jgi:hypothetical protein